MIPLKDCTPYMLAVLSVEEMGLQEVEGGHTATDGTFIRVLRDGQEPWVFILDGDSAGQWNPAEGIGDAVVLVQAVQERLAAPITLTFWPACNPLAPVSAEVALIRGTWATESPARSLTLAVLSALGVEGWEEDR